MKFDAYVLGQELTAVGYTLCHADSKQEIVRASSLRADRHTRA